MDKQIISVDFDGTLVSDEYKDVCGLEFDFVNENVPELVEKYGDSRKIAAHYYIDDHNLTLDNWKEVLNGKEKLQDNT